MNYLEFYKETKRRLTDGLISLWASGHAVEQEVLRDLLDKKEPLIAEPIFQTIFPWKTSEKTFEEHIGKTFGLEKDFVEALSNIQGEFCFPKGRKPYRHQSESWKRMLVDKKTIVVTSGTGSGKTECFIIPVLQDLYRERCNPDFKEGVQAIFLYPLNALMKNQRERIHQWSKALPKPIRYAIYNGEMPDSGTVTGEAPQVITRKEMRQRPPQILFTNPTMLNYMLVRSEDQPILEKSKGRLRWILLDEAHTYSGSSAAELALQLRRVVDAFGVTIEQVNFAVTSATMGGKEAEEKLKRVVSQLTGKELSEIVVINGQRIIPELDKGALENCLSEINSRHLCNLTALSVEGLRKKLNDSPALSACEIGKIAKLSSNTLENQLSLIDDLGDKMLSDNTLAILPTRAHFFIRAINGIYSCVNSKCRPKDDKLGLGAFTTYQNAKCPHCGGNMVEVASCLNCGEFLIVCENHTTEGYRLRTNEISLEDNPFEADVEELEDEQSQSDNTSSVQSKRWNMFVCGESRKKNPRNLNRSFFEFDISKKIPSSVNGLKGASSLVFQEVLNLDGKTVCPCCGVPVGNRLGYLRASSNMLGRFLTSTVLDNATPMDKASLSKDSEILYEGKKFITFTDSRQGTAKFALGINQDMERNWIRSEIYHTLAEQRQRKTQPQPLSDIEQGCLAFYKSQKVLPAPLKEAYEMLLRKEKGNPNPEAEWVPWEEIKNSLIAKEDLKRLCRHLITAKSNADGKIVPNDFSSYADALFLDQFGWIPKRKNSLETLGLVHVVYPLLMREKVPAQIGAGLKNLRSGISITDEDWQNFLKICVDYQIRGGKHFVIPGNVIQFLVQNRYAKNIYDFDSQLNVSKFVKWPQVRLEKNGKLSSIQSKLVLLLMAGLGLDENLTSGEQNLVNEILREAWKIIRDNLLQCTDTQNKGYRLNLLDKDKVNLQIIEEGWICPVDNVVVDTLFRKYSPRMCGVASKENFARFHIGAAPMKFPYFPYACGKKVSAVGKCPVLLEDVRNWIDANWVEQKQKGILVNSHYRILFPSPIFLAGEHSAQQQSNVLAQYEKEFNLGHLNILSCSTTMEMGVDLKGISAVVMNSVPPKPANYQQRVGRAGRRGETKALALTYCSPNPVGLNAFRNPRWPLEHRTEVPDVKLSSPQIVQRHINAYFLENFVQQSGGMGVQDSIDYFFVSKVANFKCYLQDSSRKMELNPAYKRLVFGSCLEKQTLDASIEKCLDMLEPIKQAYEKRRESLMNSITDAQNVGDNKAVNALECRLRSFKNTFELGYLAEQNFLPSAGIPTGLVVFNNVSKENYKKGNNKKLPTQHLSRAISMYAPGKQVVINEWCYQSSGIILKSKFDSAKRDVVQHCADCGYSQLVLGAPLLNCPNCGSPKMKALEGMGKTFTEVVEPAGFSVDWLGGVSPSRVVRSDNTMCLTQPLLLQMKPWPEKEPGIKISIRTSMENSEILFYNSGVNQTGFMLCPYCGRMESESELDMVPDAFVNHTHLQAGGLCPGAGNGGAKIRRHVALVGRYQTDFVEVKFYDENDHEIDDSTTLYSLGVILSRKLTELLGVNEGEIDFGYNGQYHSIFIYDTALGGAGYSPLLCEYKNSVLDLAREALREKCCNKACTRCLVDRSSQWYINYLDRQKASEWLEMEYRLR